MADHSVLIRIGDSARFQIAHGGERFLDRWPHLIEEIIGELHPADVDGETEIFVAQEILLNRCQSEEEAIIEVICDLCQT